MGALDLNLPHTNFNSKVPRQKTIYFLRVAGKQVKVFGLRARFNIKLRGLEHSCKVDFAAHCLTNV